MRDAEQRLATDRTVPVQFPDRLHVPYVREAFLRQVSRAALGARHRVGFAGLGQPQNGWHTPETRRFKSPATSNRLLPLSARSTMRPAISRQIAEPRGSVRHSQRSGKTLLGNRTENRSRASTVFLGAQAHEECHRSRPSPGGGLTGSHAPRGKDYRRCGQPGNTRHYLFRSQADCSHSSQPSGKHRTQAWSSPHKVAGHSTHPTALRTNEVRNYRSMPCLGVRPRLPWR